MKVKRRSGSKDIFFAVLKIFLSDLGRRNVDFYDENIQERMMFFVDFEFFGRFTKFNFLI